MGVGCRWIKLAVISAIVVGAFVGYIPVHESGDGLAWKDGVYRSVQQIIDGLPEEDRERVVLMPPDVSVVFHAPCWPLFLKWHSYACIPADRAVLGFLGYSRAWTHGREYGVVFQVGHELGHLDQPLSSLLTMTAYPREHDADCMGGAYAAQILGQSTEGRVDLRNVMEVWGHGSNPASWNYHGNEEQRIEAALLGYDGGEQACLDSRLF